MMVDLDAASKTYKHDSRGEETVVEEVTSGSKDSERKRCRGIQRKGR